ncbi:hypothetical protein EDB92DRAFT_1342789 [Lactarius akahatsu]|uniref:Jacalin-type lectin domain-containing protein n=1 Tax=Lactarius akahatsu TaxID=416441 RepID=A0AAD4LAI9_9AGAM|nr:hypothetical protein EDB92DRAFT_1342789 [Lactarius akahatsu]
MSFTVAANIRLAGSAQGNFLDDLTSRTSFPTPSWSTSPHRSNTHSCIPENVGQWPKTQAIRKITNVVVYTGDIIDSVRITYDVENGGVISPVTVQHGGNGGIPSLTFAVGADEKLVAVYGSRLVDASPYGNRNIVHLSFVVVNTAGTVPTVQVYSKSEGCIDCRFITKIVTAASGVYGAASEKFELAWPLTAASSYTFQPDGMPDAFLQALGFSNALDKADPAVL